ncbi:hypothetical protein [uncultured Winogradskyella sp.]|uniref:hypothetical protein n=1 Tax=Winogradskyella sp. 4-2091 TaxID=3381659 RepID=UPI002612AE9F|nr:hypothetical protein [uncultured Winogradskyella sp.]
MKYYSYIDEFSLNIEELISLSPYKLKEIIDKLSKQDKKYKKVIINGLEDDTLRSYHVTVEKNPWLKHMLFEKFDKLELSQIELNIEYLNYLGGFKFFIEPYLRPILPNLINQLIEKNELKLLLYILNQTDIFSSNCEKDVISILKRKVNNAINYLDQNSLNNLDENIKYIKNYRFYETLNLYEPHLKVELIKLYDNIIAIVTQFDVDADDPIFRFVSQAQVAFQKSQIDDVATKLFIDNNAENAKDYAYKNSSIKEKKSNKPIYQQYGIYLVLGITTVIVLLFAITFKRGQSYQEEQNTSQTELNSKKKKRTTYDNRIRFYYSLKRITKKGRSNNISVGATEIQPFSNPFPKTFKPMTNDTMASENINVQIANGTGFDLIVFKMIEGQDESIYIPKDKTRFIALNPLDSLLFYSGSNFVSSKFSNFTQNMVISDIYKVGKIESAPISTINITAIDSINKFKRRLISRKNIEATENITLNKLSIDNLYRAYYNKYVN